MALEPLMPAETEDESHLRSVRRRFLVALALAFPVVIIAMAPHLFGLALTHATAKTLRMLELLLTLPVVSWAALDYYE